MENSKPITTYERKPFTFHIYSDRVVVIDNGPFNLKLERSAKINEMKEATTFKFFGIEMIKIKGLNGSDLLKVRIEPHDIEKCVRQINDLIREKHELSYGVDPFIQINFSLLGGSEIPIDPGEKCKVIFSNNLISLESKRSTFKINLTHVHDLEIGGPGEVRTDAGMIGGGFGIDGAIAGIGIASVINALTAKNTVNTVLKIDWEGGEVFLHTSEFNPETLRLKLSNTFTTIKALKNRVSNDIVLQLERLILMKNAGQLTDFQFEQAKEKLFEVNQ
ncbi:hypothetical protein [Geomesophilobacter sediminis]|uniref:Uncharacterized protein n=1 Tax=Geomesophilobacter sediminis TaxID=2798584 RepID=A0A8J7M2K5_9BACT|nr:hypothetical protein [Geomesophilobacter sediminis]MBJ6727583.1 hypothetical protein [Geomesophilobacter sediminis]